MEINQATSVLVQIGVSVIVSAFLYGIHCLMNDCEMLDQAEMSRRRSTRRTAAQMQVATLERINVNQLPLLSFPNQGLEAVICERSVENRLRLPVNEPSVHGFPVIQRIPCIPVRLSLEEELA